jgi:hypothetical protein
LWGPDQEQAFGILKQAMAQAPVLALRNFSQQFVLETDACNTGIGVVLMQHGHPVAYLSQALCARSQTLSTYEKECMAIILAVDKWRAYLQHREFVILTDHQSLLHLTDQRLLTGIQHKAFVKLLGLQFTIKYKKVQQMQLPMLCLGAMMTILWHQCLMSLPRRWKSYNWAMLMILGLNN